jgi:hypothetical protein
MRCRRSVEGFAFQAQIRGDFVKSLSQGKRSR